jgi:HEAT repeat protein
MRASILVLAAGLSRIVGIVGIVGLSLLAACTVPEPQRRLRADVDAAIGRSDPAAAARRYREYRQAGAGDDDRALERLAVATLDDALRASEAGTRLAAIRAAEKLDVQPLFEPVTRLLGDDDEVVRAAAAGAVLTGHPDAPAVLAASLRSPSAEARALAVTALGTKLGAPAAGDLRAAWADPDAGVRAAAIAAVTPFAEDEDRRRAAALAAHDPSGLVRVRALALVGASDVDTARAALADPDLGVRLAAVAAVWRLLGDRAGPILAPLAAPGGDAIVRLHAARLVGDLPAAVAAAATSPDWTVRAAAANAVADLRAASPLGALAADRIPAVALAAARALIRVGRLDEARPPLVSGLALTDAHLRLDAAADLARIGDARGTAALSALAVHPDPAIRAAALSAFPRSRPIAIDILSALGDDSRLVRVAAALAVLERTRSG